MIHAPAPPPRPLVASPQIVAPAPYEVTFGRVIARVPAGTAYAVLLVNGKQKAVRVVHGNRVSLRVALPARDSTIRVVAVGAAGSQKASAPVSPVFGLPPKALAKETGSVLDPWLAGRVSALGRSFRGTAGIYVQEIGSGKGAAWNARARLPAASALKLAIAVEMLRAAGGPPAPRSGIDALLRRMLLQSDNAAANQLEIVFGGSITGGSARVNALLRALGLRDSDMYGGYELPRAQRPIPIDVESQPAISRTKYSTAWDLARLIRAVYLASGGRGPLLQRIDGFSAADARYLLYLLVHVSDRGKLDRFLPPGVVVAHKAGWNSTARVDSGLVFWSGGAFVATVMTWSPGGVGTPSDVLAGRVAQGALARFGARGVR